MAKTASLRDWQQDTVTEQKKCPTCPLVNQNLHPLDKKKKKNQNCFLSDISDMDITHLLIVHIHMCILAYGGICSHYISIWCPMIAGLTKLIPLEI